MSARRRSVSGRGGEPFIWLTGGALTLALLLVVGLIALILGERARLLLAEERGAADAGGRRGAHRADRRARARARPAREQYRIKLKVGNRDLYGADFQWIDETPDRQAGVPTPTSR